MDNFIEDVKKFERNVKIARMIISLSLLIFFGFLSFKILKTVKSFLGETKNIIYNIDKSYLYKDSYRNLSEKDYRDIFSFRIYINKNQILDKEQWNSFNSKVPSEMKNISDDYIILFGFLEKIEAMNLCNKLKKNKIIVGYKIENPKINLKDIIK